MSILEVARIQVDATRAGEFESAFARAITHVRSAPGHQSSQLMRVVDSDGEYLFLVTWSELADHVERFVKSSAFQDFSKLIDPFLTAPPAVTHVTAAISEES